ncbi:MAG: hypothetical protein KBA51_09850 [Kiritimatiellae bacterium]|nr:hypothetical protein [Kiritimatiellia bacterium]
MTSANHPRWLVLLNPKSGLRSPGMPLLRAMEEAMDGRAELLFQISRSVDDGQAKARHAVEQGMETVVVVGGDGMVNSIGTVLVGTATELAVIPAGSGNGWARHFGMPLSMAASARALASAVRRTMDVGYVNDRPFFVTCSLAWDAALAEAFDRYPVRGVLSYVLAGAQELGTYPRQSFSAQMDGAPDRLFSDPLVFTVANLTQYGGGARIAPGASADDGWLDLVVLERANAARAIGRIGALFQGHVDRIPEIETHRIRSMRVVRERAGPIQIDGEVMNSGPEVRIEIRPGALNIRVPPDQDTALN